VIGGNAGSISELFGSEDAAFSSEIGALLRDIYGDWGEISEPYKVWGEEQRKKLRDVHKLNYCPIEYSNSTLIQ